MIGKIIDKKEVAQGTLQVVFETNEPFTFKAGQYCFVTLKNPPYPDDRGNKRHFSIVNSPNKKGIITATTRLRDSGFKKSLKELPIGTEVELGPIAGSFTLPDEKDRPLVFIAGGIGITPFMSMLRYVFEQKLPYKITLNYSNRDQDSTAYLDELQNYQLPIPRLHSGQATNYQLILTMTEDTEWAGEKRRINAQFIKDYITDLNGYSYLVVGPPPMVEAIEKALKEAGVEQSNIKIENFTGY